MFTRLTLGALMLCSAATSMAAGFDDARLQLQPFSLQWMNNDAANTMYNSSEHPAAVYVLEAYFKNCPYCNDNAPMVDQLREHYADRADIQIVDVGRDCRDSDYSWWISNHNPNHPVLRDCDQEVLDQLGVSSYPTTAILDCNLVVKKINEGSWSNSDYRSIVAKIDALLSAGCTPQ